jgi:uncharacterized membrane protein YdcZ (DUF606 family)
MLFALFLTTLVGVSIVAQGSVNAQLLRSTNLWLLLTIGNAVCMAGSLIGYASTKGSTTVWAELTQVPLRVLIPSLCGLAITAGMPLAIGRVGVPTAVTVVIAVQIITSLLWERLGGGASLSPAKIAEVSPGKIVCIGSAADDQDAAREDQERPGDLRR